MSKEIKIYKKENFSGMPFFKGQISFQKPNEEFKLMLHEKELGVPEDDNFIYKFNSSGLRSDEFIKSHDGKHILFAGCSETEGLATKLENIWAHQLYTKIIKEEKCSGFFNVGVRAVSISAINRQIINYMLDYGKPDVLFIQYPDFYRFFKWNEKKGFWEQRISLETMASYNLLDKFELKDFKDAPKNDNLEYLSIDDNLHPEAMRRCEITNGKLMLYEYMSDERKSDFVINALHNFMLMEQICKLLGIQLFWGTWDQYAAITIKESNLFNNYVDTGNANDLYKWADSNGYTTKDLSARDTLHSGICQHTYWSDMFFKKYKELK